MHEFFTRRLFMLLWFCVGLYACQVFNPAERPLYIDNQIYFFMSERVASGVPPHVSLVDHKNALSTIITGAGIAAMRPFGVDDVIAAKIVSVIFTAGTVVAVWLLAWRLSGSWIAAHMSALLMLVFVDYFAQGAQGVRPKVFMAFFVAASLAAQARDRLWRTGALGACAFLCWQPALLIPACLAVTSAIRAPHLARFARVAGGAVAAFVLYEAYFLWHGALGEQLFQNYVMSTREEAWPVPEFLSSLDFIVRMGSWRLDRSRVITTIFLIVASAAPLVALRYRRATQELFESQPAWAGLALSTYATLAFTFVNHQAYPDMFFVYPSIATVTGLSIGLLFRKLERPTAVAVLRWGVLAVCATAIFHLAWERRTLFTARNTGLASQRLLADQVDTFRDHHGSIWAIGCPHLLAMNRQDNFVKFSLVIDPNIRAYIASLTGGAPYMPLDDARKPPGVILTSRGNERKVIPWLPRFYYEHVNAAFKKQGIRVWFRRKNIRIPPTYFTPPQVVPAKDA